MDAVIYNIIDLREEINRLKTVKKVQEEAIASHFKSPAALFHTVTSWFTGSASKGNLGGIFGTGQDIVSLVSRFVLPLILNKTLFRSSNFLIKALVGIVSQQASGFINEKSVISVWDKVMSLIQNVIPKKGAKKTHVDYGIPPDSETY